MTTLHFAPTFVDSRVDLLRAYHQLVFTSMQGFADFFDFVWRTFWFEGPEVS
jgi:hypothetical protein